jgi:hypothetical protein
MKGDTHMMKQEFGRITAVLMLSILLVAAIAAGPALVKDLMQIEAPFSAAPAGSLPMIVDWTVFLPTDRARERDSTKKCAGRARRADGSAGVSCSPVIH